MDVGLTRLLSPVDSGSLQGAEGVEEPGAQLGDLLRIFWFGKKNFKGPCFQLVFLQTSEF